MSFFCGLGISPVSSSCYRFPKRYVEDFFEIYPEGNFFVCNLDVPRKQHSINYQHLSHSPGKISKRLLPSTEHDTVG